MITITESAARQIVKLVDKQELEGGGLRVGVKAGGCSGFEYTFAWETTPKAADQIFEGVEGAKVFVDPRSLKLLDGTTLDYDTGLLSKGFVFQNPQAKNTCGCGVSFSIEEKA
ncbi:MAG: iron-sulfur cluster assembly accessory protein [Acidobacteriota bacterium]|nr:iron-sulfur cluster assembly accessory protein [Acidobacteriota bacterium]